MTSGNTERRREVVNMKRGQGAPNRQITSAHDGIKAEDRIPRVVMNPLYARQERARGFKHGVLSGVLACAIVACLILWLWIVPMMDAAAAACAVVA